MIKVGIIGCGRIADLHYEAYVGREEATLCAICDANPELLERRRREWGVAKAYLDYRDLLADREIDAVEIVTPQTIHEPMVIAAAQAGKHIAVQKPMTTSLESARRMLDAVEQAGIVFKVTDNYLFYPPIVLAKGLVDTGVIGEPAMLRMKFVGGQWQDGWEVPAETWGWRVKEVESGRGIQTFDHGHHMWSTAWYLMGEIERVCAWVDSMGDVPGCPAVIDCPAVIMWKYQAPRRYGVCDYTQAVEMPISSKYYACDEWFEITGSRGIILIRRCTGALLDGPAVQVYTGDGWRDHEVESDWASGFRAATGNFIGAILGRESPLLTGGQALNVLKFALALRRSSDRRREVYLDELGA